MPVDIVQLHYILSAVASTGKIVETTLSLAKQGMRPDYNLLKIESDKYAADLLEKDGDEEINNLASRIPKHILDAVADSIDQLNKRIAGVLGNLGMEMHEVSRRVDGDRDRICAYIVELSKFGKVPDSMMVIWNDCKCVSQGYKLL